MASRAESDQNLVANGAGGCADLVDGKVFADEGGNIAAADRTIGYVGDIDTSQVHRNVTDDGAALLRDDSGTAALAVEATPSTQQPVGVTECNDSNARGASCRPSGAVANGLALLPLAHLHDASGQLADVAH